MNTASPWLGRVIEERYELERAIGHGGMGEVYAARDRVLGHEVAVKLLSPLGLDTTSGELEKRFEVEARILARLGHPGIVRPVSWGRTEDGKQYIVTELLEGDTLRNVLRSEGPMDPARVARICSELCGALAEAHAAGVVHRDIKPANVFLRRTRAGEEHACLLDFGVAKLQGGAESEDGPHTQTGILVGTPQYMAPEAITGQPVDGRADLFALGLVAYVALAGRHPFKGTARAVMLANAVQPIPRVEARSGRTVPLELEQWMNGLLEKDPELRPSTALQARAELDAWRNRASIPPEPAPEVSATAVPTPVSSLTPLPSEAVRAATRSSAIGVALRVGAGALLALAVAVPWWLTDAPEPAEPERAELAPSPAPKAPRNQPPGDDAPSPGVERTAGAPHARAETGTEPPSAGTEPSSALAEGRTAPAGAEPRSSGPEARNVRTEADEAPAGAEPRSASTRAQSAPATTQGRRPPARAARSEPSSSEAEAPPAAPSDPAPEAPRLELRWRSRVGFAHADGPPARAWLDALRRCAPPTTGRFDATLTVLSGSSIDVRVSGDEAAPAFEACLRRDLSPSTFTGGPALAVLSTTIHRP